MSDFELEYSLLSEGRLNLMHLPPGAIAWLWDRPGKQVDAAEALATSARAYDNPVVDATLLRSDHNVLILKCEGGECFRIYPDGGYSYDSTPMDMGGCSSVLRGDWSGCPHKATETNPLVDGEHNMGEGFGNDEHMDYEEPTAALDVPQNMTNLAGSPTMDEDEGGYYEDELARKMFPHARYYYDLTPDEKQTLDDAMEAGELDEGSGMEGNAGGDGTGTGTPGPMFLPDQELEDLLNVDFDADEFADECRGYSDEELDSLAVTMGTY